MISKINAVGVWFYSITTKKYLFLMRNDEKYFGHWALPGGKIEDGEALVETIIRECTEELGTMPKYNKLIPIEKFTIPNNYFCYHTFFCVLENEFIPILNHEHIGYAWINEDTFPSPLHPGLLSTIKSTDIYNKIKQVSDLYISQ